MSQKKKRFQRLRNLRRKPVLLLSGFVIGVVGFFFIPAAFKIIFFLVPLFLFCVAVSSEEDYFNMNVFILFSIVFFFNSRKFNYF